MKGSAYACLNMDIMMMSCYEKSVNFLRNTGWIEELSAFYYNIGATYISLKKYNEAIYYLKQTEETVLKYMYNSGNSIVNYWGRGYESSP